MAGQPKAYTARKLKKAVEEYFASITRQRTLTEKVPTDQLDKYGHPVLQNKTVLNSKGNPVIVTEYVVPPSKGALARFLGIHRSTWDNYHDSKTYPEFQGIVTDADDRILAWNEEQLLTRSGKDIKGIEFNLENNYGYRQKSSVDVGGEGLEAYLNRIAQEGGGQEF